MSLFIDRRLRAFRGPQKNNDSDEMAPLKSSSKFLLHFSCPPLPLPFSGHINIHTNEGRPKEQAMENEREKERDAHTHAACMHTHMRIMHTLLLITNGF